MAERPWGPAGATDRGQLSMAAVEAAVGVVLVLSVAGAFALGVPAPSDRAAQLDAYARDAGTVLASEPPQHGGATRLDEVTRSADDFERERAALERRVERILPDNLLFRVTTPYGTIGFEPPAGATTGTASTPTGGGTVTVEVWYG